MWNLMEKKVALTLIEGIVVLPFPLKIQNRMKHLLFKIKDQFILSPLGSKYLLHQKLIYKIWKPKPVLQEPELMKKMELVKMVLLLRRVVTTVKRIWTSLETLISTKHISDVIKLSKTPQHMNSSRKKENQFLAKKCSLLSCLSLRGSF